MRQAGMVESSQLFGHFHGLIFGGFRGSMALAPKDGFRVKMALAPQDGPEQTGIHINRRTWWIVPSTLEPLDAVF